MTSAGVTHMVTIKKPALRGKVARQSRDGRVRDEINSIYLAFC